MPILILFLLTSVNLTLLLYPMRDLQSTKNEERVATQSYSRNANDYKSDYKVPLLTEQERTHVTADTLVADAHENRAITISPANSGASNDAVELNPLENITAEIPIPTTVDSNAHPISISIKPEIALVAEIPRPATAAIPLTAKQLHELSIGKRYLDCTGIPTVLHAIIADYLTNDWFCAATYSTGDIYKDAAIAADGSYFVAIEKDGSILVKDLVIEQPLSTFGISEFPMADRITAKKNRHFNRVICSPDARVIATTSTQNMINIHVKHATGIRNLHNFQAGSRPVMCLAFSADGKFLASVNKISIKIWDIEHAQLVSHFTHNMLPGMDDPISSIAFHPDGKSIAYTAFKSLYLVPLDKTKNAKCIRIQEDYPLYSAAFTPDGSQLVAGTHTILVIWNLATHACAFYKNFSMTEPTMKSRSENPIICTENSLLWPFKNKITMVHNYFPDFNNFGETSLEEQSSRVISLSLSKNNLLLSLATDGTIKLWKRKSDEIQGKAPHFERYRINPKFLTLWDKCEIWEERNPRQSKICCRVYAVFMISLVGTYIGLIVYGLVKRYA